MDPSLETVDKAWTKMWLWPSSLNFAVFLLPSAGFMG